MWVPQGKLITSATVRFRTTDLGGVRKKISHLPTPPNSATAFVEPLFALNCPGSDLFALGDGESDKGMERDGEARRLFICKRSLAPFRPAGFDKWRQ